MVDELDPLDLVRALNEQGKDERNDGRPEHRIRPGGTAHVTSSIGSEDCWCGRPAGHDWVGREDGAPHPRYPT